MRLCKMKNIIVLLLVVMAATAIAAPITCRPIDYAELQTYSDAELKEAADKYLSLAGDVNASLATLTNCVDQRLRIARIQKSREADKAKITQSQ